MIPRLLWWCQLGVTGLILLALTADRISPLVFWPASFSALLFPTFFIVNVLFGIYWFAKGEKRALLALAVFLVSVSSIQELIGFGESRTAEKSISIASGNLLGGELLYEKDDAIIRKNVQNLVSCLDADVVVFQETPQYEGLVVRFEEELKKAGYRYQFNPTKTYLSCYSKYPLLKPKVLADYNNTNGIFSALIIPNTRDTLQLFGVHLMSNKVRLDAGQVVRDAAQGDRQAYWTIRSVARNYRKAARARARQVEYLGELIKKSKYPVLAVGDFNDTPRSYTLGEIRRAGLIDAFRQNGSGLGITYPGTIPGLRIDYILSSPSLEVLSADVIDCGVSDHRATTAVFGY